MNAQLLNVSPGVRQHIYYRTMAKGKVIIIYDGKCPVCVSVMEWIRQRDPEGIFEFVPYQDEELEKKFPGIKRNECEKMVHLITPNGSILKGEDAIREVLRHIRGYAFISKLLEKPLFKMFAGAFYRWFSRHRYHISQVFTAEKS